MIDRERVLEELALALEWCSENDDPRGSVAVKIFAVRKALELLKEQPQWIKVEDRLPKSKPDDLEYPTVIIALPDGSVELGCYYESTREWGAGEYFDRPRNPIAWMPLPEPPEEVIE